MDSILRLNRVNKNYWFLAIFLAAVLLYMFNINFSDIWIDEAFTKALVKHSFGDITELIKSDYHPPLYFYGLKIFVLLFGVSDFTIRLFSVFGVLAIIALGYFAGQRVFGKPGALYFCLLILVLPMLVSFSHEARMYTWGAFSVTGIYLYSVLFLIENKLKDLLLLMLFSLLAAYTHYYGLLAAFWVNVFVLAYLLFRKNKNWKIFLGYSFITLLLYLPWLIVLLRQLGEVEKSFWVPPVALATILSCFITPFAQKIWLTPSWTILIIFYGLTLWVIFKSYVLKKDRQGVKLDLAILIFGLPFLTALAMSLFSQSILFVRYMANLVVMLAIPPTLFFITFKNKLIKGIILAVLLGFNFVLSYQASFFSYGPYKQSVEYLHRNYTGTKKVFHVVEVTAGPFAEYSSSDIRNYWYDPDSTIVYTNMKVFSNLQPTDSIGKVLKKDEQFCLASFAYLPFNEKNQNRILAQSQLIKIDTVVDNKTEYGTSFFLYFLKYNGSADN